MLNELRVCWDLLCYARSEWCLEWNPLAMCGDATPSGWRLTAKCGDKSVVKQIGRVKERVRFKLMPGVSARDQVLTRSGLLGFGGRRLAWDLPGKMCTGSEREAWEAMSYK